MSEPARERLAAQPGLYGCEGDSPPLYGKRCSACGFVFFPPHPYGCESCGARAEEIAPQELQGRGVLHAFATVHRHQGGDIEAPFTVAVVVLDGGPVLRVTLTVRTDDGLAIGDRVRSVLIPCGHDDDGREIVELRFEPTGRD